MMPTSKAAILAISLSSVHGKLSALTPENASGTGPPTTCRLTPSTARSAGATIGR
jgi:hypothetical protein